MTLIDTAIVAILVFFVVWGLWFGLVRQVIMVLALVLAFFLAGTYAGEFQQLLAPLTPGFAFFLSYLLLLLTVYLAIKLLALFLRPLVNFSLTPWFDRVLGGFFGLAKAYLLLVLVYLALTAFSPKVMPLLENSYFHPHLKAGASLLQSWVRGEDKMRIFSPGEPIISAMAPRTGPP